MGTRIIFVMLLLSLSIICRAQTSVYFTYDDAGNRKTRTITLPPTESFTEYSIMDKSKDEKFEDIVDVEKKIIIYPNPTKGQLKIELSGYSQTDYAMVYLYNLSGNLLISQTLIQTGTIDLSEFKSATYLLKILIGKDVSEWKIIKE